MSIEHKAPPHQLPCFPCPHQASCCAYGSTLSEEEAAAIEADFGPGLVFKTRWGEYRTRVRNKRCVMFRDGGCAIHAKSYYPAICRAFPWYDAETGGRYEYDIHICGEFTAKPELVTLQYATPSNASLRKQLSANQPEITAEKLVQQAQ